MPSHWLLVATTTVVGLVTIGALSDNSSDVVSVTTCDLVDRPLEFANHHVHVRGTIFGGLGYSSLVGQTCQSGQTPSVLLELPQDDDCEGYERGWSLERYVKALKAGEMREDDRDRNRTWTVPLPLESLSPRELKAIHGALNHGDDRGVAVWVTGRFDYVGANHGDSILGGPDGLLVKEKSGRLVWRGGFGHLNMWSGRIVLEHVELMREAK